MIRILEMFGEPITYGGQESVVYNMLSSFDEFCNFNIDLFTPYFADNKNLFQIIKKFNGTIYTSEVEFRTNDNRFKLKKTIKEFFENHHNYDVVHIHTGSLTTMLVYSKLAKEFGIKKVIVHSHTAGFESTMIKKIYICVINKFLNRYVDFYFGCDKNAIISKFGNSKLNEAIIINNGIDIKKFKFNSNARSLIRNYYNINNKFVVGFLGRLSFVKNIIFIINVIYKVQSIDNNIVLLIVGSGELENDIKLKVKELKLENNVIFTGNQIDTIKFYSAFDCFVLPSFYEGLPVTAIEAQVSGLPTIISDKVTKNCCISEKTEFLSIDDLNLWMNSILKLKNDYHQRVPNDGINFDKFDNKKTYKIIEELYNDIV